MGAAPFPHLLQAYGHIAALGLSLGFESKLNDWWVRMGGTQHLSLTLAFPTLFPLEVLPD